MRKHADAFLLVDAHSAFQGTGLATVLRERGIKRLLVGGPALDYCVKATCLDAVRENFRVALLLPATRPVDVSDRLREERRSVVQRLRRAHTLGL